MNDDYCRWCCDGPWAHREDLRAHEDRCSWRVACPRCGVGAGERCRYPGGQMVRGGAPVSSMDIDECAAKSGGSSDRGALRHNGLRMACRLCAHPKVKAKGLCGTCHRYQLREGRPRSVELIVKHGQWVLERRGCG
jgi:hypothetical protein